MDDHSLEARLDRAAPPIDSLDPSRLDAMIADARGRASSGRRGPRLLVGTAIALGLMGGAGAAAAGGLIEWIPEVDDPVGGLQFTMTNGFTCEMRASEYTLGADDSYIAEINRALEDWYASANVIAAAQSELPQALSDYDAAGGGTPSGPESSREHEIYVREWMAWSMALMEAEQDELERRGFVGGDPRRDGSERASQIVCFDQDGELYTPGPDA